MAKTAEKTALSKKRIERLPTPTSGRKAYHDSKTPGLTIYVMPTGAKVWYVYKRVHGRPVRYRIGSFPQTTVEQAREVASQVLGRIAKGDDPQAERQAQRAEMTFGEMFAWWRDFWAVPHKRKWQEPQRLYDKFLKRWANRPGSSISGKEDIIPLHRSIGADGRRHYANRVLQLVRAIYNRAISDAGWEGRNPAKGVAMFEEESRARFLEDGEICRFFAAVEKQDQDFQDLVWLAVLTGARRSNLFGMRWDQIQGDLWRIPSTTTKSKKPIEVPLVSKALEILLRRRGEVDDSPWVFPAASTSSGHVDRPGKPWDEVRKAAKLQDLRWHDLRRSLGSWATMTGSNLPTVGKMLGHGAGSSATAVYARLDNHTVKQAVERATDAILERATKPSKRRAGR